MSGLLLDTRWVCSTPAPPSRSAKKKKNTSDLKSFHCLCRDHENMAIEISEHPL